MVQNCPRTEVQKTEVVREEVWRITIDGRVVNHVDSFIYLGGTLCINDGSARDVRRSQQELRRGRKWKESCGKLEKTGKRKLKMVDNARY